MRGWSACVLSKLRTNSTTEAKIPRNGSGTYTPYTPGNPVVTGTTISSTTQNNTINDIATALSGSIAADGQTTTTVAVPFAQGLSSAALVDISAAGGGQIKFPATQNASANANTLDDYEEGTWTPADGSGAALSLTIGSTATYTKIGRLVIAEFDITYPATVSGSNALVSGLPAAAMSGPNGFGGAVAFQDQAGGMMVQVVQNSSTFRFNSTSATLTNANMSGKTVRATLVYFSA